MGFFDALSRGLERSREALNEVFYFGGEVDEDFWEDLEDTLVMGDMGAEVAIKVSDDLRDAAAKKNLKTAPQLRRALAEQLEQHFVPIERDPFSDTPSCVLFVGINGAGKTTTVGNCLLYTSDAADEEDSVDLGGRRNIEKKKKQSKKREKKTKQRDSVMTKMKNGIDETPIQ